MKHVISALFVLLMMPNLLFASTQMSLKDLLDDYTFSMTVVWDQKDSDFARQKQMEFEAGIDKLISEGLTKKDVLDATGVDMGPLVVEVTALDLKNSADIAEFIKNHKQFKKGASWTETVAMVAGISVFVFIFATIINRVIQANKKFYACVEAHGGNEQPCIR